MRKSLSIILAASALAAALSCERELQPFTGTPELEDGGIKLEFVCASQLTKTTMPGEDDYNENTLTTIDYFLYPEGETDADAYIKGRVTLSGRTSYNVLVNTSQLSHLFSGAAAGSKCDVYAIANYPGATTDFDAASDTLTLHNLAVSNHFNSADVQTDFVMSGYAQATVINKNKTKAAEGTVNLNRAASKVTFECHIKSMVEIKNYILDSEGNKQDSTITKWVPLTEQMGVYLVNGFADGTVGGSEATMDEGSLYRYSQRALTDDDSDGWYTCAPFYSYPQSWHHGDEREPFIKLVVPWAYLNSEGQQAGQKQFYYKVPCPGLKMDANTWYHIKLDVAILGGDDFEAMLEINNGEYYVVEWNTQTIVEADAEIKDARYISSPSNAYNMYNVKDLDVLITSSHEAELVLKSVTYYDFKNRTNINYTSTALSNNWISYNDATRTFSIYHPLNNDISTSAFDSSPYIFTFEIRHSDDNNYTTGDIVVTQYPAMYIKSELSNGKVFVNDQSYTGNSSSVTVYDDSSNSIGSIVQPSGVNGSGDNNNQNQYTVYVTTLPSGSPYVIGDPRIGTSSAVTTLSDLSNYQPTAEDTQNVIAPVFKIASSYGKTSTLWYNDSKTRCAAYQENGYPAGRWRLPTVAEIEFLVSLSEKDKIPALFTVGRQYFNSQYYMSYYWAGGFFGYGPIEVMDFSDKTTTTSYNGHSYQFSYTYGGQSTSYHCVYTRCVYDVWYWGEDQDEDHLTSWGGYQTTQ